MIGVNEKVIVFKNNVFQWKKAKDVVEGDRLLSAGAGLAWPDPVPSLAEVVKITQDREILYTNGIVATTKNQKILTENSGWIAMKNLTGRDTLFLCPNFIYTDVIWSNQHEYDRGFVSGFISSADGWQGEYVEVKHENKDILEEIEMHYPQEAAYSATKIVKNAAKHTYSLIFSDPDYYNRFYVSTDMNFAWCLGYLNGVIAHKGRLADEFITFAFHGGEIASRVRRSLNKMSFPWFCKIGYDEKGVSFTQFFVNRRILLSFTRGLSQLQKLREFDRFDYINFWMKGTFGPVQSQVNASNSLVGCVGIETTTGSFVAENMICSSK